LNLTLAIPKDILLMSSLKCQVILIHKLYIIYTEDRLPTLQYFKSSRKAIMNFSEA
jgi:hypothetical protein